MTEIKFQALHNFCEIQATCYDNVIIINSSMQGKNTCYWNQKTWPNEVEVLVNKIIWLKVKKKIGFWTQ